jgi:hypothetical protein
LNTGSHDWKAAAPAARKAQVLTIFARDLRGGRRLQRAELQTGREGLGSARGGRALQWDAFAHLFGGES